jgi:hypothetical protein
MPNPDSDGDIDGVEELKAIISDGESLPTT